MKESPEIAAEFSFEKEKVIAKSFSQRFQWEMILIGLGQAVIWLSLWPLVLNGFLDLWAGFLIASYVHVLPICLRMKLSTEIILEATPNSDGLMSLVGHITLDHLEVPLSYFKDHTHETSCVYQ